jgi:hypothetical protein
LSAQASVRTARESSSLKLSLKTAEGDTVEISLSAQSLSRQERGSARGPSGKITTSSAQSESSLQASVNVTGDLNEAEVEDIRKLLQAIASGKAPEQTQAEEPSTLAEYQYDYTRSREVTESRVALYA